MILLTVRNHQSLGGTSMDQSLDRFLVDCRGVLTHTTDAAERVTNIAPLMAMLLQSGPDSSNQSTSTKILIITRGTPFTSVPMAISRCSLSYGFQANGLRCTITEVGVWSAWLRDYWRSALTCRPMAISVLIAASDCAAAAWYCSILDR